MPSLKEKKTLSECSINTPEFCDNYLMVQALISVAEVFFEIYLYISILI